MKVEIRNASSKDAGALKAIEKACRLESWSEEAYGDAIKDRQFKVLVATCKKRIVGMLLMRLITIADTSQSSQTDLTLEVELLNIGVLPDFQKAGVASRLLSVALKSFPAKGKVKIALEVRISNSPAIRFYRKKGFRDAGIRRGFYTTPVEDALVMTWETDKVLAIASDSALLSKT